MLDVVIVQLSKKLSKKYKKCLTLVMVRYGSTLKQKIVYILKCESYVKIGLASNLKARLSALQVGNPFKLEVLAHWPTCRANSVEAEAHKLLAEYHHDREWFLVPNDSTAVSAVKRAVEKFQHQTTNIAPKADPQDKAYIRKCMDIKSGRIDHHDQFNKALDIIENCAGKIDPLSLAKQLGMSLKTLQRLFGKRLNIKPHKYIARLRVLLAADKIKTTSQPIREIAIDCGFHDQSHLTKNFKLQMGITPAKFRKNHQ